MFSSLRIPIEFLEESTNSFCKTIEVMNNKWLDMIVTESGLTRREIINNFKIDYTTFQNNLQNKVRGPLTLHLSLKEDQNMRDLLVEKTSQRMKVHLNPDNNLKIENLHVEDIDSVKPMTEIPESEKLEVFTEGGI